MTCRSAGPRVTVPYEYEIDALGRIPLVQQGLHQKTPSPIRKRAIGLQDYLNELSKLSQNDD